MTYAPVWPKAGDKMRFLGKNGYPFELEEANKLFRVGEIYTVTDCNVEAWNHSVEFQEVDGRFNGVMFERAVALAQPAPPSRPVTAGADADKEWVVPHADCLDCQCRPDQRCAGWQEKPAPPAAAGREEIARIINPDLFVEYDLLVQKGTIAENGKPWAEVVFGKKIEALHAKADAILALGPTLSPQDGKSGWQDIAARPEIDSQPRRQFVLIEGSRDHSGASWYRQAAGEAWIRKPGGDDEMLQYRKKDILRICAHGDIDPYTARVTHWMPCAYPAVPRADGAGGAS